MNHDPTNIDDTIPEVCARTLEQLQHALDGEIAITAVEGDRHLAACSRCRGRVRAAKLFANTRITSASFAIPVEAILSSLAVEPARRRRRWSGAAAGLSIAAAVFVAVFAWPEALPPENKPPFVKIERPAPRLDQAFVDAGQAIEGLGRRITKPPLPETNVLADLTHAFSEPLTPMTVDLEPAAASLAALPDAALTSLEPVTAPAARAFTQFFEDVSRLPSTAPKSKS